MTLRLRLITGSQAKIVGGALATVLVFFWSASLAADSAYRPSGEVAAAVGILVVALVDIVFGGLEEPPPAQVREAAARIVEQESSGPHAAAIAGRIRRGG